MIPWLWDLNLDFSVERVVISWRWRSRWFWIQHVLFDFWGDELIVLDIVPLIIFIGCDTLTPEKYLQSTLDLWYVIPEFILFLRLFKGILSLIWVVFIVVLVNFPVFVFWVIFPDPMFFSSNGGTIDSPSFALSLSLTCPWTIPAVFLLFGESLIYEMSISSKSSFALLVSLYLNSVTCLFELFVSFCLFSIENPAEVSDFLRSLFVLSLTTFLSLLIESSFAYSMFEYLRTLIFLFLFESLSILLILLLYSLQPKI